MSAALTLAVDCMGGDHGPAVIVPAIGDFLAREREFRVLAVGRPDALEPLLADCRTRFPGQVDIVAASEVVAMDEPVASALRSKKNSSMRVAIEAVREGRAAAVVSAGNTGALMAVARYVLKTLPGIDRPAICSVLPAHRGGTYVLDLGANVDCTAEQLLQFGVMGSLLASALEHKQAPSVGLLNVGTEEIKGSEAVRKAGELLRASDLNFIGNVEGSDIFMGEVDVVVCDGFVGNVALKASEGLAQMIGAALKEEFSRSLPAKVAGLFALPVLRSFRERFDHRRYNGACLLGLNGLVLKSHGSADRLAFACALERAAEAARQGLSGRIAERMIGLSAAAVAPGTAEQATE